MKFSTAAETGNRDAQYWLGRLNDAGLGMAIDEDKAYARLEKIALQNTLKHSAS